MQGHLVLGGPETLVVLGVQIKILSALFGLVGVLLGHVMSPPAVEPLSLRRHAAVIVAGMMLAVCITIGTGQQPLMVFGWSIGIGFAGITLFKGWAARATAATKSLGNAALDELSQRLAARKDNP